MSINDIAFELGFFEKEKAKMPEARFHTLAYRHRQLYLVCKWNKTPKHKNLVYQEKLLSIFELKKSCMRCKKKNNVINAKNPFCSLCVEKINLGYTDDIQERTPDELYNKLEKCVYSIGFRTVTGDWTYYWTCSVCKRDNLSVNQDSKFQRFKEGYNIFAYSVRTGSKGTYCIPCLDECFRKEKVY